MTKNQKILTGVGVFAVLTVVVMATLYSTGTLFRGAVPVAAIGDVVCKTPPINPYVGDETTWKANTQQGIVLGQDEVFRWSIETTKQGGFSNKYVKETTVNEYKEIFTEELVVEILVEVVNKHTNTVISDGNCAPSKIVEHAIIGVCLSPPNPITNTDLTWGAKIDGIQTPGTEEYGWLLTNETTQDTFKKQGTDYTIVNNYPNANAGDVISAKVAVRDMDTAEQRVFDCPSITLTALPLTGDCDIQTSNNWFTGEPVTFDVTVQNGTGPFDYEWTLFDDTVTPPTTIHTETGKAFSYTFQNPVAAVKPIVDVTDTATSQTGQIICADFSIQQNPTPPAGPLLECINNPPNADVPATVEWKANLQQGQTPVSYEWEFMDQNGHALTQLSSQVVDTITETFNDPVLITARVRGTDTNGNTGDWAVCDNTQLSNPQPYGAYVSECIEPTSLEVNQTGQWEAVVTGGSGVFTYNWELTDKNTSTVEILYGNIVENSYNQQTTVGATYEFVDAVTSDQVLVSCQDVTVEPATPGPLPLTADCSVDKTTEQVGNDITWTATNTGGTTPFTYIWNGPNNLSDLVIKPSLQENEVIGTYNQPVNNLELSVTIADSNGQNATATCPAVDFTTTAPPPNPLTCTVSPSSPKVGDIVTWQASYTGSGTPTYVWAGTNINGSTDDNPTAVYTSANTYNSTVTATVGGQTYVDSCSVTVNPATSGGSGGSSGGAGGSALNPTKKPSISSVSVDLDPFNPKREVQDMYMNLSNITDDVTYTFTIYNAEDTQNKVISWTDTTDISGYQSESWDGKDEDGDIVDDGEYILRASAREISSNYTLPAKTVRFDLESSDEEVPEDERCEGFIDVKASDPFCDDIKFVLDKKLLEGFEDRFMSGLAIQRDQSAKVILLVNDLFDEDEEYCTRKPYIDTPLDEWYAPYVCRGSELGIITGYLGPPDAGYFRPARAVTRVEFLALLQRSLKIPERVGFSYNDVPTRDVWFTAQGNFAKDYKLVLGNNLFPNSDITRGEVARILNKMNKDGLF